MDTVIVDMQDHHGLPPGIVVSSFLRVYTPGKVKDMLWRIYMTLATEPDINPQLRVEGNEAIGLFDDLNELVTAVNALHQDGTMGKDA